MSKPTVTRRTLSMSTRNGRANEDAPNPASVNPPPMKEPAIRTRAMPKDTNSAGDIWGGWLLAQMDLAGEAAARERTRCRVVTVAVDAMEFLRPVKVGDVVSFYADVVEEGRTSLIVEVRAIANSEDSGIKHRVTEGRFTFVAIGPDGSPQKVDPDQRR